MTDPAGITPDLAMQQLRQAALDKTPASTTTSGKMDSTTPPAIRKAATEFESVFASEMLSHMFSGVTTDSMFGGGNGEDMFRSMLVQQYGQALAKTGTLGIADKVAAEMIKIQEKGK